MYNESNTTDSGDPDESIFTLFNVRSLVVITLLISIIVVTITGNAITFVAVLTKRRLRCSAYYFLLSLCVSDFLIGLVVVPFSLTNHITYELKGKWLLGIAVCDLLVFTSLLFGISSVFNLCAISWDRYVSVMTPLKYKLLMNRKKAIKIIVFCWIVAFIFSVIFTYLIKISVNRQLSSCNLKDVNLICSIGLAIFCYLIPFTFLIFVNGKIVSVAYSHLRVIKCQTHIVNIPYPFEMNSNQIATNQTNGGRTHREMRTTKMFVVVTGAFLLCYTPFALCFLLDGTIGISGFSLYITIALTYLNSACNPFLYAIFNKEIRSAVRGLLGRFRKTQQDMKQKCTSAHVACSC